MYRKMTQEEKSELLQGYVHRGDREYVEQSLRVGALPTHLLRQYLDPTVGDYQQDLFEGFMMQFNPDTKDEENDELLAQLCRIDATKSNLNPDKPAYWHETLKKDAANRTENKVKEFKKYVE